MELSFKDWVEINETVFNLKEFLRKNPLITRIFHARGLPQDIQKWLHGFTVGRQQAALNPKLTSEDNTFLDRRGNVTPEAIDYYNGWNDGLASVREKQAG